MSNFALTSISFGPYNESGPGDDGGSGRNSFSASFTSELLDLDLNEADVVPSDVSGNSVLTCTSTRNGFVVSSGSPAFRSLNDALLSGEDFFAPMLIASVSWLIGRLSIADLATTSRSPRISKASRRSTFLFVA